MIRRGVILLVELAAFMFGAVLILAALAVWRLSEGPVNVDFLTPYVEDAAADARYRVELGGTEARWQGFDSPMLLIVRNVRVFDTDTPSGVGRAVVQFPEVEAGLSWRSLLDLRLVVRDLKLVSPRLWARRDEDGSFGVGFGRQEPETRAAQQATGEALAGLVALLTDSPEEGTFSDLTRIELDQGRLVLSDRQAGRIWSGEGMSATITRQVNSIDGVFELSVAVSRAGELGFARGSFDHSLTDGMTSIQLVLDEIETTRLAEVLLEDREELVTELPSIDVPVQGVVAATLDEGFSLVDATFDMSAENGAVMLEDAFFRPLPFDSIGVTGHFDARQQRLDVRALNVQAAPFGAILSGSVTREEDYWDILASVAATDFPVDRLELYWPRNLERGIGDWIISKTSRGMIESFDAAGQVRIARDGSGDAELVSLDGRFNGEGISLNPLQGLPPVRDIKGSASFDATRLDIVATEATSLDANLSEGRIAITGFAEGDPQADIEFVAAGSMATALYYLNRPRLRFIDKLGFSPAGSDGRVAGRVRLRFPIQPRGNLDDVSAVAAANIRDGNLQLTDRWRLEGMSATLSVDQATINLDGDAQLLGIPVSFTARRLLDSDEVYDSRVDFDATIEADRLPDFGIPPIPSLFGPIAVSVAFREGPDDQLVDMQADLSEAGLAIPQVEWAKPVGEPALITSTTRLIDWVPQAVPEFAFEGAGLIIRGAADLGPGGDRGVRLEALDIAQFLLRDNDLAGTVTRQEGGEGWRADITGSSLSLRPLVRRISGGGVAAATEASDEEPLVSQPLQVEAQIDQVVLADGKVLQDVVGSFSHDGDIWNAISLQGIAEDTERGEQAPINVRFALEPEDGRNFWVSTTNFGTVLNALNVTDQVYGGELALTALLDLDEEDDAGEEGQEDPPAGVEAGQPAMVGDVKMTSYRVARAPAMAQLLVALSLNGLQGELEEEGILFNGLEAGFTFDQGVLTVIEGNTGGSGLGLTLEGTLDTRASAFDMSGTIVPLRGINRLLNQVPVLGELLGGKNEGLFAFTYNIEGPVMDPDVSVNPLSVLAPGILRDIFRFRAAPGEGPDTERIGETD